MLLSTYLKPRGKHSHGTIGMKNGVFSPKTVCNEIKLIYISLVILKGLGDSESLGFFSWLTLSYMFKLWGHTLCLQNGCSLGFSAFAKTGHGKTTGLFWALGIS